MERRNLIYWIVLIVLVAALGTVGVLILRKRSTALLPQPIGGAGQKTVLPPGTRPIESYVPERPWQEGDAPIPTNETTFGGVETETEAQP